MVYSKLFTSESVSAGHPDKIADQISDAILDEILEQDKHARVACETFVKTGMVMIGGEISTSAWVDVENLVRDVVREIGYTSSDMGFDADSCAVLSAIGKQSSDIAQGVDHNQSHQLGAGDQGLMFGYATNETDVLMPAPLTFAHRLMEKQAMLRNSSEMPWMRPDAKSQVTVVYEDGRPTAISTVVLSTQHDTSISHSTLVEAVIEALIKPTLPEHLLTPETRYIVNPTGRFVVGGPLGDCGLTGRKIIVDSYGGMARHGGGCFSGKDPSKVDRSAAYAARYIAKNIVAAGLCDRCEIQLSYAIGLAEPVSVSVETFGTHHVELPAIEASIKQHFDLTPQGIIDMLNLLQPIYRPTATYGHFGREQFPWEAVDKALALVA